MKIDFNFTPDSKVSLAVDGQTETIDLWSRAHRLFEGHAGRVNVYDAALSTPSAGTAVVRSDGRTTVDLRGETGAAELSVTLDRDRKGLIRTQARAQERGFCSGRFYWLAQDGNGRFKPEPGQRHRRIHVSASAAAMTREMIAAHAGVAVSAVTGAWLVANPQYGASPQMPVTDAVRKMLTDTLWSTRQPSRSDWVLYERGHEYPSISDNKFYWRGESALHPLVIGAWGSGARPIVTGMSSWVQIGPRFILFRDLAMRIANTRHGHGIIFENCRISANHESNLTESGMITLRECSVHDIAKTTPGSGRTTWDGSNDRISGLYAAGAKGMLFDSCLVDRNGWAEGYDYNRDGTMPMAPSDRNHGLYLTFVNLDIHVRDSMISRNSSCGLQIRVGGQYERNLFADNNVAAGLHSGTKLGYIGQFTNFIDNVNFGAGCKKVNGFQGAINWGFDITGNLTAMIGCVVAHVANPDDPAEIEARGGGSKPYNADTPFIHNDTQVWKWVKSREGRWVDERVDGMDPVTLDQTTLQRFAAQELGRPGASLNDLVALLRDGEEYGIGRTIREAVAWTKARFGTPLPDRGNRADMVFRPDPRTEGFRWDNRLNWSTLDLPGRHAADSADLDGHDVLFGTVDCSLTGLTSRGGRLEVTSGRLSVGALADAAAIAVQDSGQIVLGATTQSVVLKASGGRAVLNGAVADLDLEARGDAEVLLGSAATIPAGKALILSGERALVGWDGTGTATLTVRGRLEFRAGMTLGVTGTLQNQQYVELGRQVSAGEFSATIGAYEDGNPNSRLVLTDVTGLPVAGDSLLVGLRSETTDTKNEWQPRTASVVSILSRGMPMLQRFRSGSIGDGLTEPTVAASLVLAAGSTVAITRPDLLAPGSYDLTGPGVTVTNQGATLPAGVTVTGGRMVLTVG